MTRTASVTVVETQANLIKNRAQVLGAAVMEAAANLIAMTPVNLAVVQTQPANLIQIHPVQEVTHLEESDQSKAKF